MLYYAFGLCVIKSCLRHLYRLVNAKRQCSIWDNTTHINISAPHNECTELKCTALKYTDGNMRFGILVGDDS